MAPHILGPCLKPLETPLCGRLGLRRGRLDRSRYSRSRLERLVASDRRRRVKRRALLLLHGLLQRGGLARSCHRRGRSGFGIAELYGDGLAVSGLCARGTEADEEIRLTFGVAWIEVMSLAYCVSGYTRCARDAGSPWSIPRSLPVAASLPPRRARSPGSGRSTSILWSIVSLHVCNSDFDKAQP